MVLNARCGWVSAEAGATVCCSVARGSLNKSDNEVGSWSIGAEYDHVFMGDSNNSFSVANPIVAGALNRISQDVDMVTLRVNYRFGWDTTPARY